MNSFCTQSYAGKYVPAIGYKIHTENMNNPAVKINLKGLAIGDGLCDPENVLAITVTVVWRSVKYLSMCDIQSILLHVFCLQIKSL